MAEPLLNLAPKTDVTQAAVRMDTMSSANQSLGNEPHPFARVLAGQAGEGGEVLPAADGTPGAGLGGKPVGQPLPAAGKELPDASRLLELAGLPLQALEPETAAALEASPDATPAPLPEATAVAAAGVAAGVTGEAVATEAVGLDGAALPGSGTPVESPVDGAANPAVALAVGQVAVETGNRGEAGPVELPGRRAASPAPAITPPPARSSTGTDLDPGLPIQDPARTVSAAVHQALQQRAETRDPDTRFGELMRVAATSPAATGETGARPEQASGAGLQGSVPAASTPSTSALPSTAVAVPLRQPGWDQALGDQVQWMVGQKLQGAEIRLNPAHLGPMEVRIQVQHDQANITFSAQHGVVRDALEAAIPRLREMLGESGLNLANVQVSDQSFAQQRGDGQAQSFDAQPTRAGVEDMPVEEVPVTLVTALRADGGSIDYFA